MVYKALFEPAEEGGFVVVLPDLGHGATQGETEAAAMEMAEDFLVCVIGDYMESGKPLPTARAYRGKKYRTVQAPAMASAKAELYRAFLSSGIGKAELARRIGVSKTDVERLFDLTHDTRLDRLEAAFRALGKRLSVAVHDEAA